VPCLKTPEGGQEFRCGLIAGFTAALPRQSPKQRYISLRYDDTGGPARRRILHRTETIPSSMDGSAPQIWFH